MGDRALDLATIAVLAFVAVRLAGGLRHATSSPGRRLGRDIVGGIRWRHIWPVPVVLGCVLVLASLALEVPGLDWGWWSAVGGSGNPVFGSSDRTAGTAWEWIVPAAFVLMLVPALPLFAFAEERVFRRGAERWSAARRTAKAVQFGLAHALIGIPLGVALALSVGGGYFTLVYLAEYRRTGSTERATIESARAHTAYNGCILVLLAAAVLATV